jgi:DNA-binding transcriptional ArsR family regulator
MSASRATIFAALGDPIRLRLVERLADGQARSIHELSSGSPISRQAMTKHLRVLEQARLVNSTRFGREVRFRLEEQALADAHAFLGQVAQQWEAALRRLANHVREP